MIVNNLTMSEQYNRAMRYDREQDNNYREHIETHIYSYIILFPP